MRVLRKIALLFQGELEPSVSQISLASCLSAIIYLLGRLVAPSGKYMEMLPVFETVLSLEQGEDYEKYAIHADDWPAGSGWL